ncbi:hypothetical protein JHK86_043427 [Glycine max]|nr:hypothetical protein JHK86_043427 [Glycine max]
MSSSLGTLISALTHRSHSQRGTRNKSSCSVYEVNQSKEATGSVTGCMTIKGEAFTTLVGHTQCVSAMIWPQRESIYSASWDHSIRKWDVKIGKKLTDLVKL